MCEEKEKLVLFQFLLFFIRSTSFIFEVHCRHHALLMETVV